MRTTVPTIWGDPDVARVSLATAAGLSVLVALALVGTAGAGLAEVTEPRHSTLLTGLQVLIGVGVLLAAVNGYLGGGPVASLALVVAPTLVVVAGMLLAPLLGLSQPDTSGTGALLLDAYFLLLAAVLGIGGYVVGRSVRWIVGGLTG